VTTNSPAGPPAAPPAGEPLHASAVVVGEAGILFRGRSGSGKSTLARQIVAEATRRGSFARLLADDRVRLFSEHGRIVARPHPSIAGKLEVRGIGIVAQEHVPAAVIRLCVDCDALPLDRLPGRDQMYVIIAGVTVRRIVAGPGDTEKVLFALEHPLDA
jgi:HPr kinase/phosphorylase